MAPSRRSWRPCPLSRDPTLVRHTCDLHVMEGHVDPAVVAELARAIAEADAKGFGSHCPAYAADIAGETRKVLAALQTDPVYRRRYAGLIISGADRERPEFGAALGAVVMLADGISTNGKERKC